MTTHAEPELLARRVAPFGPPAFLLALLIGAAVGGWNIGWSAAIGIAVIWVNTIVEGYHAGACRPDFPPVLYGVAMGGFVVRMAVIVAIMCRSQPAVGSFSPLAFGLAVVPGTLLLLGFEMKLLAGGLGPGAADPGVAERGPRKAGQVNLALLPAFLAAPFERPTTKDFVWPCWGPEISVGGDQLLLQLRILRPHPGHGLR